MVAGGCGGAIVNVSGRFSTAAGNGLTVYCSSKAALDMLTKVMALELGPHKVNSLLNVNTINRWSQCEIWNIGV